MKYLLLTWCLLMAGCESKAQIEQRNIATAMKIAAWNACISSGGAPIEAWLGAPSMARCDYREVGNE